MGSSEELVDGRLREWGFRPERFSKNELRQGKTPDRRVYRANELVFFLEVKEVAAGDWLGGERADPRFNRLTADIHDAVKQFDSVNADREVANVMAFVNRDSMCGPLDLYGVLTGDALATDSSRLRIYGKYASGRIQSEKFRVDAYLWFDEQKAFKVFVNEVERRHSDRLRAEFDVICAKLAGQD